MRIHGGNSLPSRPRTLPPQRISCVWSVWLGQFGWEYGSYDVSLLEPKTQFGKQTVTELWIVISFPSFYFR